MLRTTRIPTLSRLRPWSRGPLAVGAGLSVLGVTVYVFLLMSARALGPQRYGPLSVLWAMVFLICGGFFLPVEQELTRGVVHLRSRGSGTGPLFRRAAIVAGGLAGVSAVLAVAFSRRVVDEFFDGQTLVLVGFVLALVAYACQYVVRGLLAGSGRFRSYGMILALEGVVRLSAAAILIAFGVRTAGPLALAVGITPFLAIIPAVLTERNLLADGPERAWSDLSRSLSYLLVGSLLSQVLIHVGPLAVKVLAGPSDGELTGRFFAGVLLTRAPLFLFLVVQASALPRLAALRAMGDRSAFTATVKGLITATAAGGFLMVTGALLFGHGVLRLLFGARFVLSGGDLALLSASTGAIMVALVLTQSLVALERHPGVALSWLSGVVTFVLVTAVGTDPVIRVEVGLVAGSVAAACCAAAVLRRDVRRVLPAASA